MDMHNNDYVICSCEGRKKGREGGRGKFCAREPRAAPEGRRETRGREGEVRGREGEGLNCALEFNAVSVS